MSGPTLTEGQDLGPRKALQSARVVSGTESNPSGSGHGKVSKAELLNEELSHPFPQVQHHTEKLAAMPDISINRRFALALIGAMLLPCPILFAEAGWPVVAAPAAGGLSAGHAQQNNKDPLSEQESDQIAELRDQPVARIKLFQKFIEQRINAIKDLGANPKAADRKAELRARFDEFTRLSDELQDNLDTFDAEHADIRKALKDLVPATEKWPDVLKAAAPDPAYDFARKTALGAADSTSDTAKKLYDSQLKYFTEHKDQAGKNGTGPS
jgi:hypothetical protein